MVKYVKTIELSSLSLKSLDPDVRRNRIGKPNERDPDYDARYDFHTLFYDCFYDPQTAEIVALGPELLNFRILLDNIHFFLDGKMVKPKQIESLSRCSQVCFDVTKPARTLSVRHPLFEQDLPISPSGLDPFTGKNALYTISQNNSLHWVKDWLRFYATQHKANAVVLFDNASTAYSSDTLAQMMAEVEGIDSIAVVKANFPFGPTAEGKVNFASLFLQRAMAHLAKRRFLGQSRAVLNADIDELFHSRSGQSVFDATVDSPNGYLRANAQWVYAQPSEADTTIRHADHQWVTQNGQPKANRKWCVVPKGPMKNRQWLTHFLDKRSDPVHPDFVMWHFRQISTSWKIDRTTPTKASLKEDLELQKAMALSFDIPRTAPKAAQGYLMTPDVPTADNTTKTKEGGSSRTPPENENLEQIEIHGIRIPVNPDIITPKIAKALRLGKYEGGEINGVQQNLRKDERVLELGAGMGLVSAVASRRPEVDKILTIEANPKMTEFISQIHDLNNIEHVEVRHGAVTRHPHKDLSFYLKSDFWGSALELKNERYVEKISVPCIPLPDLIAEFDPTVIVCYIEGAELGLFKGINLDRVHTAIVEVHPKKIGEEGVQTVRADLEAAGLIRVEQKKTSTVHTFTRPLPTKTFMPDRAYRHWGAENSRVLIATCMKNEGPFILEWIAWHQALGVTDFVVYSNDCTDGTYEILSRLSALGHITHRENPAVAQGSTYFQPAALNHLHSLDVTACVDFVISIDVDEFINIHSGQGHLIDLFRSSGPFDALSMSELNHGSNGQKEFEPGWITEQFPAHQNPRPGKWKSARGVKTITRLSPKLIRIRNHRPDFMPDAGKIVWLDGSGRHTDIFLDDKKANGTDCRGGYGLVTLEHYPLRSLQSYLAKKHRGDVVVEGKSVGQRYWRIRNQNDYLSSPPLNAAPARARYGELIQDTRLRSLHEEACKLHVQTIRSLSQDPEFIAFKDRILAEAWDEQVSDSTSGS